MGVMLLRFSCVQGECSATSAGHRLAQGWVYASSTKLASSSTSLDQRLLILRNRDKKLSIKMYCKWCTHARFAFRQTTTKNAQIRSLYELLLALALALGTKGACFFTTSVS